MSIYKVKEIFTTLQGEGYHTGTPAIFVRFAGCNLWSGHEKDRNIGKGTCSLWCDTDFVGGTKYTLNELVNAIDNISGRIKYIVFTGGEPLLQLDNSLLGALSGYYRAIETNGTINKCNDLELDWICVSPKAESEIHQRNGDELKLIYPQENMDVEALYYQYHQDFKHFFLQPMDGPNREANTMQLIGYIKEHPYWRLSLQTHKFINIP